MVLVADATRSWDLASPDSRLELLVVSQVLADPALDQ
jgi:hypothetical protein